MNLEREALRKTFKPGSPPVGTRAVRAVDRDSGLTLVTKPAVTGASSGQALVETAIALTMMVLLFAIVVTAGEMISFTVGLTNAAGVAASAAAQAADQQGGNPSGAAVAAVNQEQGSSSWSACSGGGSPAPPCVAVSSATQTTGSGASITVQQVVVYGTFAPVFNLFGVSLPVTTQAGASQ